MPRQNRVMDSLIPGYCKIRKRGCSTSSSSSSRVDNYRFKRAILVGKTRVGGVVAGGSRSSTPVPTWRMTASKLGGGAMESPKYAGSQNGGGKSRPVSARKLAATLWEMNEMPSPGVKEMRREMRVRERMRSGHSGSLPPHLSDPSHSPVSERMDRSGTGSRQRRASSSSQRHRLEDNNGAVFDSLSSASLMEIETRSRAQTPSSSMAGAKTRLKDVSNALTTSKELLKIINRMWAHDNQPSSTMSLISALHAELERARLQVNQYIKEQRSDQSEISYLLKCFAEEKAAWKSKERQTVEAAIESVAGELEVERKLRRQFESLNKKLGKELAETKISYMKTVKELESEKRAREIMEQVCDELATDISEDRAEAAELKRESVKVHEEVEREREMLQLADKLREERVQMKLAEAKHQFEEKNAVVDKLRNQLESFLGNRRAKKKGCASLNLGNNDEIASYLSRSHLGSRQIEEEDDGEVEDGVDCEEDSGESDLHSIELNMDINNKSFKWTHASMVAGYDARRVPVDDETKSRNSISGKVPRKGNSLQRSISDGVEWGSQTERLQNSADVPYGDDMQRYKSVKGLRDHILAGSRIGSPREVSSPTQQSGQPWPSRDPGSVIHERPPTVHGNASKSRLAADARRSKR